MNETIEREMELALKKAVRVNAEKAANNDCKADDALKYTQAAVNAANAIGAAGLIK